MAIDFKAERDLVDAVKFYVVLLVLSLLVSIASVILLSSIVGILALAKIVNREIALLSAFIGGLLLLPGFIVLVAIKVLQAKHIAFSPKIVALIVSILPLCFIPYTFSLLAYLIPAYFSMLPANNDNLIKEA